MTIDKDLLIERLRVSAEGYRLENESLKAEIAGDARLASYYLRRKVDAQRAALHLLNERVVNQRFVLRNIERLGRGLSPEELANARETEGDTVVLANA